MTTTTAERLAIARGQLGLTLREFAEPLGVSYHSIYDWESGRTKTVPKPAAMAIEQAYSISMEWLLTGNGEMFTARANSGKVNDCANLSVVTVPILSALPTKGYGESIDDYIGPSSMSFEREWLNKSFGINTEYLRLWQVLGDNMIPTIQPLDWVFVDSTAPLSGFPNGLWLVRIDRTLRLYRVQWAVNDTYQALNDNATYQPAKIDGKAQLLGRVVGGSRRF